MLQECLQDFISVSFRISSCNSFKVFSRNSFLISLSITSGNPPGITSDTSPDIFWGLFPELLTGILCGIPLEIVSGIPKFPYLLFHGILADSFKDFPRIPAKFQKKISGVRLEILSNISPGLFQRLLSGFLHGFFLAFFQGRLLFGVPIRTLVSSR